MDASTFALPGDPLATLFLDQGTNTAALVTKEKGERKTRPLRFADAHAGLDYCVEHRIVFVFLPAPAPEQN